MSYFGCINYEIEIQADGSYFAMFLKKSWQKKKKTKYNYLRKLCHQTQIQDRSLNDAGILPPRIIPTVDRFRLWVVDDRNNL
jgi:hypothetical protein